MAVSFDGVSIHVMLRFHVDGIWQYYLFIKFMQIVIQTTINNVS